MYFCIKWRKYRPGASLFTQDFSPRGLSQLWTCDMLHTVPQTESGSPARNRERHPWKVKVKTNGGIFLFCFLFICMLAVMESI